MKRRTKKTAKGLALALTVLTLPFGLMANTSTDTGTGTESTAQETFSITYNVGENGTLSCSHQDTVVSGEEVVFTLNPAAGYEVASFSVNDVPMPLTENVYKHIAYGDLNVVATFKAFEVESGAIFQDGYANGRVDVAVSNTTQTVTLGNMDGQYGATQALYNTTVDLRAFEMTFTLDQMSVDGAFRLSFMAGATDFPVAGSGDGFGIYFWDETAWGYTEQTSLRCDFYTYAKSPAKAELSEAKAFGCEAGNAWRGQENYDGLKIYIKVWRYDNDNLAIHLYGNDKYEQGGLIPFSKLPSNFDYTNCYLMFTPDIDISRQHSYAKDVQLTFEAKMPEEDMGSDEGTEETVEYSITYYDNDTIIRVGYADEGDKFYNYNPPEKDGFEFDGWYLDKEFTEIFNIAAGATEDVVVYAKYVPIDDGTVGEDISGDENVDDNTDNDNTGNTTGTTDGGCNGSIGGLALGGLVAAIGAVVLKKKKEN